MIRRRGSCPRHPTDPDSAGNASLELTSSTEPATKIVAIPDWEGRVSPVFDVAGRLLVAQVVSGLPDVFRHEQLLAQTPTARASQLAEWGVKTLLCGGISSGLRETLERADITVIPHICGGVQEVLQAYLENRLSDERFAMPGCCRGRPRCRARRRHRPEAEI
jgi:predicted Fe-Mo cluster-binding NifX family protein